MVAVVEEAVVCLVDSTIVASPVKGRACSVDITVATRRSARNVGKGRPYYGVKTEPNEESQDVAKKRKVCREKLLSKTSVTPSVTNAVLGSSPYNGKGEPVEGGTVDKKQIISGNQVFQSINTPELNEANDSSHMGNGFVVNGQKATNGVSVGPEFGMNGESAECGKLAGGPGKSAYARVKETLRAFNTNYLQFVQEEELRVNGSNTSSKNVKHKKSKGNVLKEPVAAKFSKCKEKESKRASKRPDLKAISKMLSNSTVLYPEKTIGHLPGIDVGDQFLSRAEMVVVGLHSHWLNGIDYMGSKYAKLPQYRSYIFPLAVCIVLSGVYEDDLDNSEDVIYTGQGGNDLLGRRHQIRDQKMERGNLALKNSLTCGVPVRVVRGHESASSYCGKVYTYDGLYKVIKYWAEKGMSGFTVYKYRLRRLEGQPTLTTNQVYYFRPQVPSSISELHGLVCDDISGGQENFPIPATNIVDDPPIPPTDFVYSKFTQVAKNLKVPSATSGCKCKRECVDPRVCSCAKRNGDDFPYVRKDGGRLVEAKAVVFECGPHCQCNSSCVNRTSQQGIRYRLEVFRIPKKGWAVRSWDAIPSGAPVCEYTGVLMKSEEIVSDDENNYIFDIDCLQTVKGLDGRERRPGNISSLIDLDDKKSEAVEYCIDAGSLGNVARFINHSCAPNLFVQCVLSQHHDIKMAKILLFAADNIPPLQELTYDYGYALDSVVGADGTVRKLRCFCGAADCRKWLY
ncbi:hypothetical protein HPP92_006787 [Vanilla planifolia]|uniref:Uncharacterized protein n=1 Tax=Vanilla planifolia TaxID=51239 RepID=A0A835V736_VANPL|nr:hypothetical protein HPP92_006787 [Vanilla planifolia]